MAKKKKVEKVEEIVDKNEEQAVEVAAVEEPVKPQQEEKIDDGIARLDLRDFQEKPTEETTEETVVETQVEPEVKAEVEEQAVEEVVEETVEEIPVQEIALEEVTEIADKL